MKTELNCKNCGEQPSCWYGQNKEPKKCDSYWDASDLRNNNDDLESVIFTVSDACSSCPNNPKNGGSGICHCILGLTPIT